MCGWARRLVAIGFSYRRPVFCGHVTSSGGHMLILKAPASQTLSAISKGRESILISAVFQGRIYCRGQMLLCEYKLIGHWDYSHACAYGKLIRLYGTLLLLYNLQLHTRRISVR